MIRSAFRLGFALTTIALMACGGAASSSESLGRAAPATGSIAMNNPDKDRLISGLIFKNEGQTEINVSALEAVLVSGTTIQGQGGFGVEPGESVTWLFDSQAPQNVASISFSVAGSTDALEVFDTDVTGPVP